MPSLRNAGRWLRGKKPRWVGGRLIVLVTALLAVLAIATPLALLNDRWGYLANLLAEFVGIVGAFAAAWYFFERRAQEWTQIERAKFEERQAVVEGALSQLRSFLIPWLYNFVNATTGLFPFEDYNQRMYRRLHREDWSIFEAACGVNLWAGGIQIVGDAGDKAEHIKTYVMSVERIESMLAYARSMAQVIDGHTASHPWLPEELPQIEGALRRFGPALDWIRDGLESWSEGDSPGTRFLSTAGRTNVRNLGRLALNIVSYAEERLDGWKPHEHTETYEGVTWFLDDRTMKRPP